MTLILNQQQIRSFYQGLVKTVSHQPTTAEAHAQPRALIQPYPIASLLLGHQGQETRLRADSVFIYYNSPRQQTEHRTPSVFSESASQPSSSRRRGRDDVNDELKDWAPASKRKLTEFTTETCSKLQLSLRDQSEIMEAALVSPFPLFPSSFIMIFVSIHSFPRISCSYLQWQHFMHGNRLKQKLRCLNLRNQQHIRITLPLNWLLCCLIRHYLSTKWGS